MICGLEWGGSSDEPSDPEPAGFFSQRGTNEYPYRNRLVGWFDLFGHRLETDPLKAGPFEHSIVQTNWLPSQARTMTGRDPLAECISGWSNFELHLKIAQPRLIVFLSVTLLDALNDNSCLCKAELILGKSLPPRFMKHDNLVVGAQTLKPFRLGFQEFEAASVIALPHPTGAHGLTDSYLVSFRSEIGDRIQRYKTLRGLDHVAFDAQLA